MGIYDIEQVAHAFLAKSAMTHKKLQKLCYYAQCWNFYFNNKEKLANTNFQAWVHGPVSPELYQLYKVYGYEEIPLYKGESGLDDNHLEVVDSVFSAYGKYDGNELEAFTHSEKPWINARKGKAPYESSEEIISENDMFEYCTEIMNKSQADV